MERRVFNYVRSGSNKGQQTSNGDNERQPYRVYQAVIVFRLDMALSVPQLPAVAATSYITFIIILTHTHMYTHPATVFLAPHKYGARCYTTF